MSGERLFFCYEHVRPDTGDVFYVGKGCGKRAADMRSGRNRYHKNIQAKLERLGMCVEIRLAGDCLTEAEAFALEIERIAFWRERGVQLVNQTAGGEGVRGREIPPEQRAKISAANKGKKRSPETCKRMGDSRRGIPRKEETKRKLSEHNTGKPSPMRGKRHSEESRRNMSEAAKIRGAPKHPPEVIEKIAAKHRGSKRSPEACANISAALRGKPSPHKGKKRGPYKVKASPELCELRSENMTRMWAERKADPNWKMKPRTEETRAKMSEAAKARWVVRKAAMA